MCGICGEFSFSEEQVVPENIRNMMNSLIHRGPDDFGMYCKNGIGLGHRRLSIIDLSSQGKQPMWSNDNSLCIVLNGEVYNYQEIKQRLIGRGYHFNSSTDTEVVINAIHCFGIETALAQFIGMFAFALWNSKKHNLVLCRDRAGIKPLYYYLSDKTLLFGSELKAIMAHPDFKKELNPLGLGQFFVTGDFLDNSTVFKDTFKVSPGHYITLNRDGDIRDSKYWGLDSIARNSSPVPFEDAADQLEELLISSFGYRLVSDVPVGLFLSGGIDSSLVSALLKNATNADIINITIGFNENEFNEAPKAKRVAEQLGVRQIIHYVDTNEAQETLLNFTDIYDEPFGDTSGIPTYILSKLAREHVKVALSADGGDEQFCGYENYASYLRQYSFVKKIPWIMRIFFSELLRNAVPYRLILSKILSNTNGIMWNPQYIARYEKMLELLKIRNVSDLIRLMYEKAWAQNAIGNVLPGLDGDVFKNTVLSDSYLEGHTDGIMDLMMRTDYELFLRDDILTKVDRASMAVSLECRDPMLDHRIAEFAFSLPIHYLYKDGEHKRILKHILGKWVSADIIQSPKRGFMIPLYYWLRGAWKPIVMEYLSAKNVKNVGVLDPKKVEREVSLFYKYKGCRAEKIWMMLNFQMWAEKWYVN